MAQTSVTGTKTARYICSTDDPDLRKRLLVELGKHKKELSDKLTMCSVFLPKTNDGAHRMLKERIDAEWKKCQNLDDLVGSVSDVLPLSSSSKTGVPESAGAAAGAGCAGGAGGAESDGLKHRMQASTGKRPAAAGVVGRALGWYGRLTAWPC